MNHFRCISHRISWCELKRSYTSLACKIKIPARINRGPTDILHAIESTIPIDSTNKSYVYRDDPFLIPRKRIDYRSDALAYEAGKKAAMWLHKEHKDLFPKHLSEPEIQAFKPVMTYTDKSQVSEEMLLSSIHQCKVLDALHIYKLLESDVSVNTKQMLLELLCFHMSEKHTHENFFYERWFTTPDAEYENILPVELEAKSLHQFLIAQDSLTAALAYNTMICGWARHSKEETAWLLYEKCTKKNVPLNVTTYNHILMSLPKVLSRKDNVVTYVIDILNSMSDNNVKPNIKTLNATLKTLASHGTRNADAADLLLERFKAISIEPTLTSYYYILNIFTSNERSKSYRTFINILNEVKDKSFTIQDPMDGYFFLKAMCLAESYADRDAGDTIHKLLHTENNIMFMSHTSIERSYYNNYLSLILATSTLEEFFQVYDELVPNTYIPTKWYFDNIVTKIEHFVFSTNVAEYIAKIWTDATTYHTMSVHWKLDIIKLMKIDSLPVDSPSRTIFADAAWNCWKHIKNNINAKEPISVPLDSDITGRLATILLHTDRKDESIEILRDTVERSDLICPTMTETESKKLFEICISKRCIKGALLVLEYRANSKFENTEDMVTTVRKYSEYYEC